jgi:hypothetical protein
MDGVFRAAQLKGDGLGALAFGGAAQHLPFGRIQVDAPVGQPGAAAANPDGPFP